MSEEKMLDDNSFEPNDYPVEASEVEELRQQLRDSFTSGGHGSLPPPPPSKQQQTQGMQHRPNRGRHHRAFRILVIGLALIVVLASVIALASYLTIEERSDPPRGSNNGPPPDIDVSFAPSSATIGPSSIPSPTTPSPVSSPEVTTRPPTRIESVPTISPTTSPILSTLSPTTRNRPEETKSPTMNPTTTRAPTAPLMPISIGLPGGPTTPTALPVLNPVPVPVSTQSPIASPLAATSAPVLATSSPTIRRIPEETQSPTMNPTTTRAPSVGLEPIPVDLPTIIQSRTRAPTDFQPVLIAPIPYHRIPTQPPTECQDTGDCDILINFPYLRDFLCFDEEFGIADECALSCGVCGGDVSPLRAYCVDDKSAFFFINDEYGYQSCKWLSMKAALQQELCATGKDGYKHCPRLCGRCDAVCQDDAGAAVFINYEIGYETCAWLANNLSYQVTACKGEFAAKSCPKTCGICSLAKKSAQTTMP